MVKYWDTKLTDDEGNEIAKPLDLGDICTVSKVDAHRVWIGRGWVCRKDVLPLEQATAYFTEQIRNHPQEEIGYYNLTVAHRKMGQADDAANDYSRYWAAVQR